MPKPPALAPILGSSNVMTREIAARFDAEQQRWWDKVQTVLKQADDYIETTLTN